MTETFSRLSISTRKIENGMGIMTLKKILSEKPDLLKNPKEFLQWYEKLRDFDGKSIDGETSRDYQIALSSATRSLQAWNIYKRNFKTVIPKQTLW